MAPEVSKLNFFTLIPAFKGVETPPVSTGSSGASSGGIAAGQTPPGGSEATVGVNPNIKQGDIVSIAAQAGYPAGEARSLYIA